MKEIAFTTTAMPRPDLLYKTFESFKTNLINCDLKLYTLYINIDPFPNKPSKIQTEKCLEIANSLFKEVIWRTPLKPNFSLALQWLWRTASEDIILHIEDDWELLNKIDFKYFISLLVSENINHIMLRSWSWNDNSFFLSPGFLSKELYKFCSNNFVADINPEVTIQNIISKFSYVKRIFPEAKDDIILKDLGRNWMKQSEYVRGDGNFVCWEEKNEFNIWLQNRLADQNLQIKKKDS